ncbi:Allantoin permease [Meyerozyma sp. JA9]|nr:Allantoin permease [Meyerozyma sp. JA9]
MSAEDQLKMVSITSEQVDDASSSASAKPTLWRRIVNYIQIDGQSDLTAAQLYLFNYDLKPVEKDRRLWSWFNFVFFWIADSFNINTWQIAATGVQAGMTWWQTWLSVWLGYLLCGVFITIGARIGVFYHVSFPVAARSSFGIYGSLWPIINRVFMSLIWYSVQCSVAGPCIEIMLRAIFTKNLYKKIGSDNSEFLGFFLFWLFSLPAIWFPPHQIRHLFTFKAYVVPVAGITFLVWTLVKAHGAGPVIHKKSEKEGSELAWLFVESTMNALANFATLIVNAPDFARFADKPSFGIKYLVHTVSVPLCFSITALIGILVGSASEVLYGEPTWSPLDVLDNFLNNYTPGNRAGSFFLALAFALAQLGTNISANSLSFGTDVTAVLPRFLNIRRGGYICAILALAIYPAKLNSSASKFTTYLSAYSVFLSSIAGVVACDYFFVRRGYIKLSHLYSLFAPEDPSSPSVYKYNKVGINWRAFVAYLCGIVPNITGFVGAVRPDKKIPIGATEVYRLNFFMGFFSAFIIYATLVHFFPIPGTPNIKTFEKGWFEEWQEVEDFEDEIRGHVVHEGIEKSVSFTSGSRKYV